MGHRPRKRSLYETVSVFNLMYWSVFVGPIAETQWPVKLEVEMRLLSRDTAIWGEPQSPFATSTATHCW